MASGKLGWASRGDRTPDICRGTHAVRRNCEERSYRSEIGQGCRSVSNTKEHIVWGWSIFCRNSSRANIRRWMVYRIWRPFPEEQTSSTGPCIRSTFRTWELIRPSYGISLFVFVCEGNTSSWCNRPSRISSLLLILWLEKSFTSTSLLTINLHPSVLPSLQIQQRNRQHCLKIHCSHQNESAFRLPWKSSISFPTSWLRTQSINQERISSRSMSLSQRVLASKWTDMSWSGKNGKCISVC